LKSTAGTFIPKRLRGMRAKSDPRHFAAKVVEGAVRVCPLIAAMGVCPCSVRDPHVTIVGARAGDPDGVRWPFPQWGCSAIRAHFPVWVIVVAAILARRMRAINSQNPANN
jgi:hypothetical protein